VPGASAGGQRSGQPALARPGRRPCSPRDAASMLAASRQTPHHQLRCNPLGSRSKCYETWGQRSHTISDLGGVNQRPARRLMRLQCSQMFRSTHITHFRADAGAHSACRPVRVDRIAAERARAPHKIVAPHPGRGEARTPSPGATSAALGSRLQLAEGKPEQC
jgi:hypothetical protein